MKRPKPLALSYALYVNQADINDCKSQSVDNYYATRRLLAAPVKPVLHAIHVFSDIALERLCGLADTEKERGLSQLQEVVSCRSDIQNFSASSDWLFAELKR